MVVMMVVGMFSTVAFATDTDTDVFTGIMNGTGAGDTTGIESKTKAIGKSVIDIIMTVAQVVALAMLAIFAVKWMMATPQKKQELKERMVYLAIGVVLLFGGPAILNLIGNFGNSLNQ